MHSTGDNADTLQSYILKTFKIYFKLTLMSPGQVWTYLFLSKKPNFELIL